MTTPPEPHPPTRRSGVAAPIASRRAALAPYARVRQALRAELEAGRFPPGARMPSEAELVERFGVSRMTVNRALRELQAVGLIERVQGVGTFAAQLDKVASTLKIGDLHDEIVARGNRHSASVKLCRAEPASAEVAARLGLAEGTNVFHTLIVHHENGVPLQCEHRWVNPACAPGYLKVDFAATTPTHYLFEVAPFGEADYRIEAARPSAQEARLLGIARDEPCLVVHRRTHGNGRTITAARLVHPGSRYLLQGQFKP